jgi:hypothetical protein
VARNWPRHTIRIDDELLGSPQTHAPIMPVAESLPAGSVTAFSDSIGT